MRQEVAMRRPSIHVLLTLEMNSGISVAAAYPANTISAHCCGKLALYFM